MNKQEFIKSIADTLKVDVKLLATELEKENDISIELPKLNSFTDEELSTRDINIKKEGYGEGVTVGYDKSAKKIKEITGVEVEGKDLTKIANAIIEKVNADAKVEPNAKVEELKNSIANLQSTVTTLESEKESLANEFNSYKSESQILSEIPENTAGLSNSTILTEMRANGFEFTDEGVVKNGELLKDNLQNPLKRQDVFNQFLTEKNWIKTDKTGRGGTDEGGVNTGVYASIKSTNDYIEHCKAKGIDHLSDDGKAILIEAKKINNF